MSGTIAKMNCKIAKLIFENLASSIANCSLTEARDDYLLYGNHKWIDC